MATCGIKFTHDASVAPIENGKLKFWVELEKIGNNRRYAEIDDVSHVQGVLDMCGCGPDDVDTFVIDGWQGTNAVLQNGFVTARRENCDGLSRTRGIERAVPPRRCDLLGILCILK